MGLNFNDLYNFLEERYLLYNQASFVENDPISVPHQYSKKEDIEISAFLTSTISWGKRTTIIQNANKLLQLMDYEPFEFISHATELEFGSFDKFVHRTFNGTDCIYFIRSLQQIYRHYGGLEQLFCEALKKDESGVKNSIIHFRRRFFELPGAGRTLKHISDPGKNAAAKRINMFLRWMVRNDKRGVDFGIWGKISPSQLIIPLDVHTGNVARKIGLLKRKTNDWQAAAELTTKLKRFDSMDPVKYDFALFGLGIFEKF